MFVLLSWFFVFPRERGNGAIWFCRWWFSLHEMFVLNWTKLETIKYYDNNFFWAARTCQNMRNYYWIMEVMQFLVGRLIFVGFGGYNLRLQGVWNSGTLKYHPNRTRSSLAFRHFPWNFGLFSLKLGISVKILDFRIRFLVIYTFYNLWSRYYWKLS